MFYRRSAIVSVVCCVCGVVCCVLYVWCCVLYNMNNLKFTFFIFIKKQTVRKLCCLRSHALKEDSVGLFIEECSSQKVIF